MNKNTYEKMVKRVTPPSKKIRDFIFAFVVGGFICVIGQLFRELFIFYGFSDEATGMCVSSILIFFAALLTGLKLFEKIAKRAGAGTLVPITGFANAVVSPAIEFRPEGHVLGIGVKMFSVAGPVILFGTVSSAIYGFVLWLVKMWGCLM